MSVVKRKNDNTDFYDAICKVDYKGADYLYVSLEEEYGSTLRSQFVREPYSTAANRLGDKDYTRIKIFDIKGHYVKTVKERKDIGHLESGIYILEYYQGNTVIKTSKLSK